MFAVSTGARINIIIHAKIYGMIQMIEVIKVHFLETKKIRKKILTTYFLHDYESPFGKSIT